MRSAKPEHEFRNFDFIGFIYVCVLFLFFISRKFSLCFTSLTIISYFSCAFCLVAVFFLSTLIQTQSRCDCSIRAHTLNNPYVLENDKSVLWFYLQFNQHFFFLSLCFFSLSIFDFIKTAFHFLFGLKIIKLKLLLHRHFTRHRLMWAILIVNLLLLLVFFGLSIFNLFVLLKYG